MAGGDPPIVVVYAVSVPLPDATAVGQKRTSHYGPPHVCFTPKSGHDRVTRRITDAACPL
jgi:hypothetical protein